MSIRASNHWLHRFSWFHRPASFSTAAQPKGVAVGGDSTVFVAEVDSVEAVRSNQKVFALPLKYTPSAIAAGGSVVAVGGEVCDPFPSFPWPVD